MIIEKFSLSAQAAIESACRLAVKKEHRYVTPWHLLFSLLDDQEKSTRHLFSRANIDIGQLSAHIEGHLLTLPKATVDSQQTPINRDLEKLFIVAEEYASGMDAKYIGVHHIMMGMPALEDLSSAFEAAGSDKDTFVSTLEQAAVYCAAEGDASGGQAEYLSKYAADLTASAYRGEIDPVIGRSKEIRETIQVLSRRMKSNPIVIGEPGVGKTALVEGLAQCIANGEVPDNLKNTRVMSLDLGQLIAGAKYRGEFEERFKRVLQEVAEADDIVMYIDEVHMLMGAGGADGAMDASNLIKPALSRGELRCIGSTTLEEYRKHIEKDAALMRRFQIVMVDEPTIEETLSILRGIKEKYEVHHGVRILDSAINAAVRLSDRYITDRFLPDKAIDLMDQAAASTRIRLSSKPDALETMDRRIVALEIELHALESETDPSIRKRVSEIKAELDLLTKESLDMTEKWQSEKEAIKEIQSAQKALDEARVKMEQKVREEDFSAVAELQYKVIPECEQKLEVFGAVDISESKLLDEAIAEEDVADTVSKHTGIPVSKMMASERQRYLDLESLLQRRVVGQDAALTTVAKAIRRARAAVQDPDRPVACFLMSGPTGVGKTELAKALAEFLFDDDRALIRIDMSEFMEKHTVARLIGAPPGYVGFEEGGILTNKVRRRPYSVILFDEVEKGHPDVFNLFLQLMDDGRLTDSQGHTVNFTNTIILMTSNLGADTVTPAETEAQADEIDHRIMDAVRSHFRPEFLNRLDDIIVFRQLTPAAMMPIVEIQIQRLQKRMADRDIDVHLTEDGKSYLADKGFNPLYGARPLKRVIQSKLQDPLAEKIIAGEICEGQQVTVYVEDDGLIIKPDIPASATPEPMAAEL